MKNSKEYMKIYITNAHAESIPCEVCGGKYKKYFKGVHDKGLKHIKAQQVREVKELDEIKKKYEELQKKFNEAENKLRGLNMN
jgi:tRNA U54 and U55 pseudouridine synthase Pus10